MTKAHRNPNYRKFKWGEGGLRGIKSKIGQLIMHDLSPAIFNAIHVQKDPKMIHADLQSYVGDVRTILKVRPEWEPLMETLPRGGVLFFHCKKDSLTPAEICDFFNESCPLSPFQLSPDDLVKIGDSDINSTDGKVVHTYWGYPVDQYERELNGDQGGEAKSDDKNGGENGEVEVVSATGDVEKDVQLASEKIVGGNPKMKKSDASVKLQKKADLEKYFRKNKQNIDELDGSARYLVVYVHGGNVDEKAVASLANDINKGVGGELLDSDAAADTVVKVGSIKKRFPASGELEPYDIFAVKAK